MVEDQGDIGLVITQVGDSFQVENVYLPKNKMFTLEEIKCTYLAESFDNIECEESDKEALANYLVMRGDLEEDLETDSSDPPVGVYAGKKYKPVALKVRPVLEELPLGFRIERN